MSDKITNIEDLRKRIAELEIRQREEGLAVKEQMKESYESLKPFNLIKSRLKEFVASSELPDDIMETALSLGIGYFTKKSIVGDSENPIRRFIGNLVQVAITKIVLNSSDGIKSAVLKFMAKMFAKEEPSKATDDSADSADAADFKDSENLEEKLSHREN